MVEPCEKEALFRVDGNCYAFACAEHLGGLVDEMVQEQERGMDVRVKYAARAGIRCSWGREAGLKLVR